MSIVSPYVYITQQQTKQPQNNPLLQLPELSPFITGYEPHMSFAISLTAKHIFHVQFQQVRIGEWVQRPQIEIQQLNNNQDKIILVLSTSMEGQES